MLIDANILLYSVDDQSPHHLSAREWLLEALNGQVRVGIPWVSAWAFVRIATNPRAYRNTLTARQAWERVSDWLEAPTTWMPAPGVGHAQILGRLLVDHDVRGALVTDAVLAAIALEHGVPVVSADSDFARFPEVSWINPIAIG